MKNFLVMAASGKIHKRTDAKRAQKIIKLEPICLLRNKSGKI
jgi:hypothetical protein